MLTIVIAVSSELYGFVIAMILQKNCEGKDCDGFANRASKD